MSILAELKEAMQEDSIKGQLAAQLHDITEQYNNDLLTYEEYEELVRDIAEVQAANDLADDEVAQRWIINISTAILSAV
jgi:hypothetical protein